MNVQPDPTLPRCPGCGGRHFPGYTVNGPVWCAGIPAKAYGPIVKAQPVPDALPEDL